MEKTPATKSVSASSMKTIDTCSWLYWSQYVNKIPQKNNEGALRGTIVHSIFEILLNKRHLKHYKAIVRANDVSGSPAIRTLLIKSLKRSKILTPDNYDMCNKMVLVGLKTDFFCNENGGVVGEPELQFELYNENPEYKIHGFIDKIVFYGNGSIKIVDYKSSKKKFVGDDVEANIQAMAYSLVGYKMFGASDVSAEFIFLRFPKQPLQKVHPTKDQLRGFEQYISYIYKLINNFSEDNAMANLAANNEKHKWLCKAGSWECPYMRPFQYFALVDKDGNVARTALEKEDLKPIEGQKLTIKYYHGCPCWKTMHELNRL